MTENTLNDQLLMDRCKMGDRFAIDALFRKHHATAFAYAYKMTKHLDEAADVVSECFLRIYRSIGRYRAEATFTAWMYKILKNCFLDMRKKNNVLETASLDEVFDTKTGSVHFEPRDESPSPHDLCEQRKNSADVRCVLDRLSPKEKCLLLLYHENELTYAEIGTLANIPAGTVKSQMHRARVKMQHLIRRDRELMEALAVWG